MRAKRVVEYMRPVSVSLAEYNLARGGGVGGEKMEELMFPASI
jgi:hypothetical protein